MQTSSPTIAPVFCIRHRADRYLVDVVSAAAIDYLLDVTLFDDMQVSVLSVLKHVGNA